MTLAFISYIYKVFIEGTMTFIKGAVIFIKGAVTFIGGVIIFIGKGSLAVERSFKTAGVGTKVVDDIEGVDERDSRWWLIIYKLKGPLLLMNNLISISNHSVKLSL